MRCDQIVQRRQRERAGADLVGHGRQADVDALSGIALALPVQRLMLAILLEQDHRQQARASPCPRYRVEWGRRLRDVLAAPAGELLAHRLHDLPLPRDRLQAPGHRLAELAELVRPAGLAHLWCGQHHALARQMIRERLARRPPAREPAHRGGSRRQALSGQFILGGRRLEVLELQFQLIEEPSTALGAPAVEVSSQLLDLQLEGGDHRLRVRRNRRQPCGVSLGHGCTMLRCCQFGLQFGNRGEARFHGVILLRIDPEIRRFLRLTATFLCSSGALRPPCMARISPVDPVQQISHLRSRDRHSTIRG